MTISAGTQWSDQILKKISDERDRNWQRERERVAMDNDWQRMIVRERELERGTERRCDKVRIRERDRKKQRERECERENEFQSGRP